jgi:hypothetical protein
MITLIGGPAAGTYTVKRAPLYLRAVVDKVTNDKDVLNELADEPSANEAVSVYKLEGDATPIHLKLSGTAKAASGFYMLGKYKHLADVDGETLRETAAWRQWVADRMGRPVDMGTGAVVQEALLCPVDNLACDRALKACCSCSRNQTAADDKRISPRRTDTDDAKGE